MGQTDINGEFMVEFTSATAGQVLGSASAEVEVEGPSDTVTTVTAVTEQDAVKTFVDAYITIDPDDVNPVGEPHTFTTTVWVDDGTGSDRWRWKYL
jgi:hypothetical protein